MTSRILAMTADTSRQCSKRGNANSHSVLINTADLAEKNDIKPRELQTSRLLNLCLN